MTWSLVCLLLIPRFFNVVVIRFDLVVAAENDHAVELQHDDQDVLTREEHHHDAEDLDLDHEVESHGEEGAVLHEEGDDHGPHLVPTTPTAAAAFGRYALTAILKNNAASFARHRRHDQRELRETPAPDAEHKADEDDVAEDVLVLEALEVELQDVCRHADVDEQELGELISGQGAFGKKPSAQDEQ